jgi:hypothetical protein
MIAIQSHSRQRSVRLFFHTCPDHCCLNLVARVIQTRSVTELGGRFSGLMQWAIAIIRRERRRQDHQRARMAVQPPWPPRKFRLTT